MKNKNRTRKNKSWPEFYAMVIKNHEIEACIKSESLYEIMNSFKKTQMILQEAIRAECRIFYSQKKKSLVLFSPKKWELNPQLTKQNINIIKIQNRDAHHTYLMRVMEDEDCSLINPETGYPCTLEKFCEAEAERSDN